MSSKELEEIRRVVLADAIGTTLEIGAGPGYNFSFYKNISKLYALEPSEELTNIATIRAKSLSFPLEFINAVAEDIPLPNCSIDTVVSTWTLCSVANPTKVLAEVTRVLRPTGRFIFVEHGLSPKGGIRLAQKILTPIAKHFTGNCHFDRDIDKLIRDAGFHIQKIEHPTESFRPLIYNYQGVAIRDILQGPTL